MSCSDKGSRDLERYPGTGCCGTSCTAEQSGCLASEPRIRSCLCRENVGCLDRADCGGFQPRGTAATGACPGPCQCAEEEAWNVNAPPTPNCEWLSNFSELRRQWSDHGRQINCKCCNCKPCRKAAPCKPCIPLANECSEIEPSQDSCQGVCSDRLSGGANGNKSSCCQRDVSFSSAMHSSSGYDNTATSRCCSSSNGNSYSSSPCEPELSNFSPTYEPPSTCQPCSPSQKPTLSKRSCCQCIPGYCMCQPMPRNCNCPPPIQIDARAARECDCECPSSPECACPPSERKFAQLKVKCPNARLCCSTPRPQPGPKCICTKCQPCLPPPCDPCTSNKCRIVTPKFKPCGGDSPCEDNSPCRLDTAKKDKCRATTPRKECQKMVSPCRSPSSTFNTFKQGFKHIRLNGTSYSPDSQCPATSTFARNRSDKGHGDKNGDAATELKATQCHCGSPDSRGCDELCDYCCSLECINNATENDTTAGQDRCSYDASGDNSVKDSSFNQDSDFCRSHNCDCQNRAEDTKPSKGRKTHFRTMDGTETDEAKVLSEKPYREKLNLSLLPRSTMISNEETSQKNQRYVKSYNGSIAESFLKILPTSLKKKDSTLSLNESVNAEVIETAWIRNSRIPEGPVLPAVANKSPRSTCKLFRSLIRAKSPVKYYK